MFLHGVSDGFVVELVGGFESKKIFFLKTLEKRIQVCGCSGQRIHLLWGGYTGKGIDVCVQELTGNATWCPGFGRGNVHVIPDKNLRH